MKQLINEIIKKIFFFSFFCLIFFISWCVINHLENITTISSLINHLINDWLVLYKANFVGTIIAIIVLFRAFGILLIACLILFDVFSTTLWFFWKIYLIFRKWLRRNKKE